MHISFVLQIFDLFVGKLLLFTTLNGDNKFSDGSYQQTYLFVGVCGIVTT